MIKIEIPHFASIHLEHLVLDYNGTLAIDGQLIPGVKDKLDILSQKIQIHVITADTFGCAKKNLTGINCKLVLLDEESQQLQKEKYADDLGGDKVIAIGNGLNDSLMLKNSALGITVIQNEGASLKSILNADIVCNSIVDALDLIINPLRIVATLRK